MVKKDDKKDDKKDTKSKPTKNPTPFENLLKEIGADDTFKKRRYYKFDKFAQNAFPEHGYNEQCDLLMLPPTKSGYRYVLCIIDIWSNYFDCEPMKTQTAKECL